MLAQTRIVQRVRQNGPFVKDPGFLSVSGDSAGMQGMGFQVGAQFAETGSVVPKGLVRSRFCEWCEWRYGYCYIEKEHCLYLL